MTEETKAAIEQYLAESDYFETLAHNYGADLLNEVVYALIQTDNNTDLLMSIFEDGGLWKHAMCLNDITIQNEGN